MLIFRSEEHVDRWCRARALGRGSLLSAETAWQLAWEWYKDKLSPDWRRHTIEEAEELFERLGLTDDFWRLR